MNKKVVIIGGGTGTSTLVNGLKKFPVDISVIVSVFDDGRSTGKLREEFDIPAVGDLRKVLASMSDDDSLFKELLEYRFKTTSNLNGHAVGNLLLAALCNIKGNVSSAVSSLSKILNIKGNVIGLTDDNAVLMGETEDGSIIEGEHNITASPLKIKDIYYKKKPKINKNAIKAILESDLIILSMGSLYTSVICNLLSDEIKDALDKSTAKIMYVCNMFTQPGETDNFKVSDHVNILNKYLGKKKISILIANNGKIKKEFLKKYNREEQKNPVVIDEKRLDKYKLIKDDFVTIKDGSLKHDALKLSLKIFEELIY